ncbi:thiol reductant ABC exporter subunit CydC [Salipaludibacillus aurantiacus]|uniref:ATP-binding cassette, subfamily C, CydC n=1 Tax=Salipaludibacillus aurantiacus TaxID=1601833 RepID=A0A1H9TW03_9BACI|nr:thiol reductant ABC exporter subunit CydC [Salipaludibacillus aurantiacus]SES01279.1 ATP-binding cassette, subfamily C, CydC [Salipaludibacillus aurantiacus]
MRETGMIMTLMLKERKDVLLSVLFGFLAGMGAVSVFANSGYLISKAAIMPPLYVLTVSIALLKLFSFTRALSKYAERYYSHRATFTILSNLRVHFFEKIEPLAPRIFQRYRSGDILSRIVGDVESLQNFFLRVFYPPIVMLIVFLATIAFTMYFSVYIGLILAAGLLLTGFLIPAMFAGKHWKIEGQVRERRGNLSVEATEFLYGFRDLKIHQKLEQQESKLIAASDHYISGQEKAGARMLFSQSINQGVTMAVSWLVLGASAYLVTVGELEGVFIAMLVMISLTVFENAVPMAAFPNHYEDSRHAAARLFSAVESDEKSEGEQAEQKGVILDRSEPWGILIDHVTFNYPGEDRAALKDVQLAIPAGSKTAVVGPSGSGKSTLLQLLLKVYRADTGNIHINGRPVTEIDEESLWMGTKALLQDQHFFYGTVRENLQLAGDGLTDDQMKEALAHVHLADFSLDDQVLEKGGNLSGGEKQRLAVARGLLKEGRLWLLDEPTSSVDVLTEKKIYDHLFKEAENDTVILVSHRLTGLEQMDRIIVMEQGKIVETGTYEELMAKQGYFYEMKQIEKSVFSA